MKKEITAPAILLFKETKEIIDNLTVEETGLLFKAVFEYTATKTVPGLPRELYIAFLAIKMKIDSNEAKYQEKCKYQREFMRKQRVKASGAGETGTGENETKESEEKSDEKPPGKRTAKKPENKDGIDNYEQADFLFTFQEKYPNKKINCKVNAYPGVNYTSLLYEIEKSEFLKNDPGVTLKWLLMNANKVVAGKYRTEYTTAQQRAKSRTGKPINSGIKKLVEEEDEDDEFDE